MTKVALVTGSSSGIGYETSLLLARNQFATYASMRNLQKGEELLKIAANEKIPLKVIQLDVDNDKSVMNAVNTIVEENGRIDILVNNAGFDMFGPLEDLTIDEIKAQFEPISHLLARTFTFCYKSFQGNPMKTKNISTVLIE